MVEQMGELGAISGKIQREVEILRKLNDALLILEIDTLGLHAELNISPDDVTKSQDFMMEFADRLCSVLKHKSLTIDLQPIIHHFQSGMKPVLKWLEREINSITSKTPHSYLIERLQNNISELKDSQNRLQAIIQIGQDRLINRAHTIIRDIGYQLYSLTWRYIPGLTRENDKDISLRALLLSKIEPCGLSWIQDILLRLDGQHATFIGMHDLAEIPILYAPPQQAESLMEMTYFYHELGHSVFSHFEEIGNALSEDVSQHFDRLRLESGPMSPEKREERTREIEKSVDYWIFERLNEIFSDIYAIYI